MKFDLPHSTIQKLHAVFALYPEISRVLIYGSRAKGNFREGSDIDITLLGNDLSDEIRAQVFSQIDNLNTP